MLSFSSKVNIAFPINMSSIPRPLFLLLRQLEIELRGSLPTDSFSNR
jgi:hypothetical protein